MIKFKTNTLVVLVSYFSYGWTKNCVKLLNSCVEEIDILIVDNNPCIKDSTSRAKSFIDSRNSHYKPVENNSIKKCEFERNWLSNVKNVTTIQTEKRSTHGTALNLAMKHAWNQCYSHMVHVEPDCIFTGNKWFLALKKAIDNNWMAGSCVFPTGHIHPTPTIWDVRNTHRLNFEPCIFHKDLLEPDYELLYKKVKNYNDHQDANMVWFDTGVKAWYECAKKGKAQKSQSFDFQHLWAKSSSKYTGFLL